MKKTILADKSLLLRVEDIERETLKPQIMAKQKNNIVMHSARGMFGGQVVFKRRAGKSFVAAPPKMDENRKPTARQQEAQKRFRTSNAYAGAALKDPDTYNAYLRKAKRGQSAHNVAVRDALIAPSITVLTAQGYSGQPGNLIVIEAIDDFRVVSVRLSIRTADNQLVEEGMARARNYIVNLSTH